MDFLNFDNFLKSLPVMVEGMGGVFLVIIAIWLAISLMNRVAK